MQVALIEAFERGDDQTMVLDCLNRYPHLNDEIITFMVALRVMDGPEPELASETEAALLRGLDRGMQRVLALSPVQAQSLADAMTAAGVGKQQLARHVHIGATVIERFVQGKIALATIPQRFFALVAEVMNAPAEQVRLWAEQSYAVQSSFRRDQARVPGADDATPQTISFADAVREVSPRSMTEDDRQMWLREAE